MVNIGKGKILRVIGYTILTFAVFHLALLFIFSIKTKNLDQLNVFNVIGISLLVKNSFSGLPSFLISYLPPLLIFIFYFKRIK